MSKEQIKQGLSAEKVQAIEEAKARVVDLRKRCRELWLRRKSIEKTYVELYNEVEDIKGREPEKVKVNESFKRGYGIDGFSVARKRTETVNPEWEKWWEDLCKKRKESEVAFQKLVKISSRYYRRCDDVRKALEHLARLKKKYTVDADAAAHSDSGNSNDGKGSEGVKRGIPTFDELMKKFHLGIIGDCGKGRGADMRQKMIGKCATCKNECPFRLDADGNIVGSKTKTDALDALTKFANSDDVVDATHDYFDGIMRSVLAENVLGDLIASVEKGIKALEEIERDFGKQKK